MNYRPVWRRTKGAAPAALGVIFCLAAPAVAGEQPLSSEDRAKAIRELEASRNELLAAVQRLTPAQWRFNPAPERWSIAECVEHIALTEDSYFQLITQKLVKAPPAAPEKLAEVRGRDQYVLDTMPDRSSKRQTSPALEPKGKSPEESLEHFRKSRDRFISYVRTTSDPLRFRVQAHRALGLIDGYQWILLAAGHVRRHIEQIEEVKREKGFPR
jgi:uncharacterized damage-inducible protein DinB